MKTATNFRTKLTITLMAISMLVAGPVLGSILPDTLNAAVVVEAASNTDTLQTTTPRLSIWQRFKARRAQRRLQRAAARRASYSEARRPRITLGSIVRAPINGAKRVVSGVKRLFKRADKSRTFRAVSGAVATGGGIALAGYSTTVLGATGLMYLMGGLAGASVIAPIAAMVGVGLVGLYASYRLARWGAPRFWRAVRGKKS